MGYWFHLQRKPRIRHGKHDGHDDNTSEKGPLARGKQSPKGTKGYQEDLSQGHEISATGTIPQSWKIQKAAQAGQPVPNHQGQPQTKAQGLEGVETQPWKQDRLLGG